ncbi:D-glycero-alpha-D-manno-heptose-1,7-bisphosphate 7-phosphatase [Streptomyces solincola]|uniref:D-glycero-alpha-D-manno-heptose-1,7-bisphosphate 7-phosphatase n=1 Tax=Streptomyces solincola TaxID=2100817 RepID=UPI0021591CB9|nr:HAD-IIIA family hydrolase [Streptomyces solincola]
MSGPRPAGPEAPAVRAVLFDRDDTLIADVPYNGDPGLVRPVRGAREAVDRVRAGGLATGVVSNQSGVGRGLLSHAQVRAVNARVEALLGPFGAWVYCPHAPEDGCGCRKPAPGLVVEAARRLGVDPAQCVVIGDIGADVAAARAAGARGVLVPTRRTLPAEVAAAPAVCADLAEAVTLALRYAGTPADRDECRS